MPELLEIRLVDSGQSAQTVADRAGSAPSPTSKSAATGPQTQEGADAKNAINFVLATTRPLAQALGVGGLHTEAANLAKAFASAADAVMGFARRRPPAQPIEHSSKPPGLPVAGAVAGEAAGATGAVAGATAGAAGATGGAATGAAAGIGATLLAVSGPVIALAAAAAAAVLAIRALAAAAHSEAERLQGLNPQLASAMAMADVRAEMADIRRAQRIGPSLAMFENDRSRINTAISDANTAVMGLLGDIYRDFHPIVEMFVKLVELVGAGVEFSAEATGALVDFTTGQEWKDNVKRAAQAVAKMQKIMEDDREEEKEKDPFMEAVLNQLHGANPLQVGLPPAAPAGAPGV